MDRLNAKVYLLLGAVCFQACFDKSEPPEDLPVANQTWTHSKNEIAISVDWEASTFFANEQKQREYWHFGLEADPETPARELLDLDVRLRQRFGENYSLSIWCSSGVFHWPVSNSKPPLEDKWEIDLVDLKVAPGKWLINSEEFSRIDFVTDRLATYTEAAALTDTIPIVILSVNEFVTLQQIIDVFDFCRGRSLRLVYR